MSTYMIDPATLHQAGRAEGLEAVSFVLRSSRITGDIFLTHFALTFPIPLCATGADFLDSL
jgi:hypothetical protein